MQKIEVSSNLQYHIEKQIPLSENIFRTYSESYFELLEEVRTLYFNNQIELCDPDAELVESDLGKKELFEGREVYLDAPIEVEEDLLMELKHRGRTVHLSRPFRTPGGPKKYAVYVKSKNGKVKKVTFGDPNLSVKRSAISIFCCFFLLSCSTVKPTKQVDDNQKKIEKEEKKVENTIDELDKNTKQKKIQTATLAAGIQHSLMAVTNPPTEVKTAKDLNERVISIVGTPRIDELNKVKQMVDLLNSAILEERKNGEKMLAEKDAIINKLQKETSELKDQYDSQMWDMTEKAKEVAKQADANKATLDSMSGMFGLNAVFWGLKKFFVSAITGIIIFGVIFLVLRILSMVNPAAGAAFSIFNMLGSAVLSLVKGLTPKAFELANFASKDTVDEYKSPLTKIVDVIQELKERQKESPDRVYPLVS